MGRVCGLHLLLVPRALPVPPQGEALQPVAALDQVQAGACGRGRQGPAPHPDLQAVAGGVGGGHQGADHARAGAHHGVGHRAGGAGRVVRPLLRQRALRRRRPPHAAHPHLPHRRPHLLLHRYLLGHHVHHVPPRCARHLDRHRRPRDLHPRHCRHPRGRGVWGPRHRHLRHHHPLLHGHQVRLAPPRHHPDPVRPVRGPHFHPAGHHPLGLRLRLVGGSPAGPHLCGHQPDLHCGARGPPRAQNGPHEPRSGVVQGHGAEERAGGGGHSGGRLRDGGVHRLLVLLGRQDRQEGAHLCHAR
mmetsp:Transcript_6651/g.16999  ORF Transcript_6651/g.16999 Transcript_6651/m.16999 type:complete len:301 (+) Transcript_6651:1665-2567(+)